MRFTHAYVLVINLLVRNFLFRRRKVDMSNLLEGFQMVFQVQRRYLDHLMLGHKHNHKHRKHTFSFS